MNDWRDAVSRYQQGVQSVASSNLASKEALLQGRASLVSADIGQKIGEAGTKWGDKLTAEGHKFMGDIGVDLSLANVLPATMRRVQQFANWRAGRVQGQWKEAQASRFNDAEEVRQNQADLARQARGEEQTVFEGRDAPGTGRTQVSNVDDAGGDFGTDRFLVDSGERAPPTVAGTEEDPIDMEPIEMDDLPGATTGSAFDTPFLDSLPSAARGVGPQGAALRSYFGRDSAGSGSGGYSGSATSQNTGDAINEAWADTRPVNPVSQARPQYQSTATAEDDEFADEPARGGPFGMPDEPTQVRPTEVQAGEAPEVAEPAAAADVQQIPSITVQDVDPDMGREAEQAAQAAEEEATGAVEDLAPEISAASSAWSAVGGFIGDAIPLVGFGLGLYGLIEGSKDISQSIKDESSDPYAAIRPKIQAAQNQISGLEANVSADEFASKIGAGTPSFGSLAAAPQMDTARQQGIALHV